MEEANKIMDEKGTQFCQMKAFMATSGGTGPEHLSSLLGLSLGQAFNRHLLNIYFAPVIWLNRASEMILGGTPGFLFWRVLFQQVGVGVCIVLGSLG